MGKKFCNIEHKWCKFLKHGICKFENVDINTINRCKRIADIETITLSTLVRESDFEKVFSELIKWYRDQEGSKDGYRNVFNKLRTIKPKKHELGDLFIKVEKVEEDGEEYLNLCGVDVILNNDMRYGLSFTRWKDWVSMFITQETLHTISKEEIIAASLYDMTFFGFEESKIQAENKKMCESIEEMKSR